MKSSASKIKMSSFDAMFETEESIAEANSERIQYIPLKELFLFHNHPFKVLDDDKNVQSNNL